MKATRPTRGAIGSLLVVAAVLALGAAAGSVAVRAETPVPLTPGACNGLLAARPGGPLAPTDLSARWAPLPGNPQVSGVLLTWQDNAGDETCYVVQVRDSSGGAWQDRVYQSANATSADDLVFDAPGDYCFRVFAANDHGASASNEPCVQVPEATVHGLPPGAAFPNPATPLAVLTPDGAQAAAAVTPTPMTTASTGITPFITPGVTASPTPITTASTGITPFVTPGVTASPTPTKTTAASPSPSPAPTKAAPSATPTLAAAPATGAGQASSGSAPWWPLALAGGLAAAAGIGVLTLRRRAGSGGRSR